MIVTRTQGKGIFIDFNLYSVCPTCRTDMGPGKVSRNFLAESIIREQVEGRNTTGEYDDESSAPPLEQSNTSDFHSDVVSNNEVKDKESLHVDNLRVEGGNTGYGHQPSAPPSEDLGAKAIDDFQPEQPTKQPLHCVQSKERWSYITISTLDASGYGDDAANCLGMYEAAGTHDGVTYYRQLHTVDSYTSRYCYRQAGKWWVGDKLGAKDGELCCDDGGDYPPPTKWTYYKKGLLFNIWHDDSKLTIQDGLMLP